MLADRPVRVALCPCDPGLPAIAAGRRRSRAAAARRRDTRGRVCRGAARPAPDTPRGRVRSAIPAAVRRAFAARSRLPTVPATALVARLWQLLAASPRTLDCAAY